MTQPAAMQRATEDWVKTIDDAKGYDAIAPSDLYPYGHLVPILPDRDFTIDVQQGTLSATGFVLQGKPLSETILEERR